MENNHQKQIKMDTNIVCTTVPPLVNSNGSWSAENPLAYSLTLLMMHIALIFWVTQAIHFVLKRFGLPKFVAQIMAGLILGRSILYDNFKNYVFPIASQETLSTLAMFGYTIFLFLTGVKMDMGMILKTGKKALAVGVLALVTPLLIGMLSSFILSKTLLHQDAIATSLPHVTGTHSLTSFPVIYILLSELKILNSELGRLALSSAIVSDLFSVVLLSVGNLSDTSKALSSDVARWQALILLVFVIVTFFIFRPVMLWMIRQTPEGCPVDKMYIYSIIMVALASGLFTHWNGQLVLLGPYIFGLAVPDGPPLGSALVDKLDAIVSGLLLPTFMTTCALRTELFSIFPTTDTFVYTNVIVIVITFTAKIMACLLPPLFCRMPFKDALALALIMSARGTVEMTTYTFLKDTKVIKDEIFALMVITTILEAAILPGLVKLLYDPSRKYAGYQKRNLMNLTYNSEMRILVCLNKSNQTTPMINLLHASGPTRENPLAVHVLHLIELLGRASPLLISHQVQKKTSFGLSYSENIIVAFNQFGRNHRNGVSTVQTFTAISPPQSMHEDICTLALDKLTHLIIIPFHRKWTPTGSIESEDPEMRMLNCSVLDMAPCSVGILIDRGRACAPALSSQSKYRVAMFFFGGSDDREALTFAKRMARGRSIGLTVIHFIAADGEDTNDWETLQDKAALKDVKEKNLSNGYLNYIQRMVSDGPETALAIRGMVDEYDLIIVGRRYNVDCPQTSGLTEWSEFPELGAIGDLLASLDLESETTVLVIKQQKLIKA